MQSCVLSISTPFSVELHHEATKSRVTQRVTQLAPAARPGARRLVHALSAPWSKVHPAFRSNACPRSTLVPSMRTTIGTGTPSSFTAAMTPWASMSQRRMPPKMLMRTRLHVLVRHQDDAKALSTCSALAPPPTSRKFAGSPPASLMMSIVAIARPAPFTMQPMLPSSWM